MRQTKKQKYQIILRELRVVNHGQSSCLNKVNLETSQITVLTQLSSSQCLNNKLKSPKLK